MNMDQFRYLGSRPFTSVEKSLFFGRNHDIAGLSRMINLERLVVLYGKSGLGKTSLLNAGVIPGLTADKRFEALMVRFGACSKAGETSPVRVLLSEITRNRSFDNFITQKIVHPDEVEGSLWFYFKSLQIQNPGKGGFVIVFDQFEELFTYPAEEILLLKRKLSELVNIKVPGFFQNLLSEKLAMDPDWLTKEEADLLYTDINIRVVMAIRSDRMSFLDRMTDYIPDILKKCYELQALSLPQAKEAIVMPAAMESLDGVQFSSPPFRYSDRALRKILDFLSKEGKHRIETFQLQVISQYVENSIVEKIQAGAPDPEGRIIFHGEDLGDIGGIFTGHYDNIIRKIPDKEQRRAAQILIEDQLIVDGNRVSLPDVVILKNSGVTGEVLGLLVNTHLLRGEPNTVGGISYELSHDTLIDPIMATREKRHAEEQRMEEERLQEEELTRLKEQQEQERAKREEKQRQQLAKQRQRQQRKTTRILAAALVVALILSGMAGWQWRVAEQSKREARLSELQANFISAQAFEEKAGNALEKIRDRENPYRNSLKAWLYTLAALNHEIASDKNLPVSLSRFLMPLLRYGIYPHIWSSPAYASHFSSVNSVSFSPDGKRIVSGSEDKTLRLWDAGSGKELTVFTGHTEGVTGVSFSPDGKRVVSGSRDNTLRLWDAESGKDPIVFNGHREGVTSVSFSPDGKRVVSGSRDTTLRLWDAESGKELGVFNGHAEPVTSVSFSPDGKRIVSGASDNTLRLWDAGSGKQLAVFNGHREGVTSVSFSPDGKRIVSGAGDKTLRLWDAESGKELTVFNGHTEGVTSVSFSPDGKRIVSGSWDKTLRLWDAGSVKELTVFKGHTKAVTSVSFSPDGKRIVSGSWDKTLRLWDAGSGKELAVFQGHTGAVSGVAFSPDGKRIVSGSWDTTLRLWDAESGKELAVFNGHREGVTSVSFSPDGKRIVAGYEDNTLRLWDVESGVEVLKPFKGHTAPVTSVSFSPDGKRIVSGADDKPLRLWDAGSGKKPAVFKGHTGGVTSVLFSPDGKRIVSGSWDNTLRLWDAESGKQLAVFNGHTEGVASVAFSPDGKRIVSGAGDTTLRLWDVGSGRELAVLEGHTGGVTSVSFSPDGKRIVSGSRDNTLRLWDLEFVNGYLKEGPDYPGFEKIYKLSFDLLPYRLEGLKLIEKETRRFIPLRNAPSDPYAWFNGPIPQGKDPVEWMLEHEVAAPEIR